MGQFFEKIRQTLGRRVLPTWAGFHRQKSAVILTSSGMRGGNSEDSNSTLHTSGMTGPQAAVIAAIIGGFFLLADSVLGVFLAPDKNTQGGSPQYSISPAEIDLGVQHLKKEIRRNPNLSDKEKLLQLEMLDYLLEQLRSAPRFESDGQALPYNELIDKKENRLILTEALRWLSSGKVSLVELLNLAYNNRISLPVVDLSRLSHLVDRRGLTESLDWDSFEQRWSASADVYSQMQQELVRAINTVAMDRFENSETIQDYKIIDMPFIIRESFVVILLLFGILYCSVSARAWWVHRDIAMA